MFSKTLPAGACAFAPAAASAKTTTALFNPDLLFSRGARTEVARLRAEHRRERLAVLLAGGLHLAHVARRVEREVELGHRAILALHAHVRLVAGLPGARHLAAAAGAD